MVSNLVRFTYKEAVSWTEQGFLFQCSKLAKMPFLPPSSSSIFLLAIVPSTVPELRLASLNPGPLQWEMASTGHPQPP